MQTFIVLFVAWIVLCFSVGNFVSTFGHLKSLKEGDIVTSDVVTVGSTEFKRVEQSCVKDVLEQMIKLKEFTITKDGEKFNYMLKSKESGGN